MTKNNIFFIAVWFLLLQCSGLLARPTTDYEAEMVVTGWLKASPQPFGVNISRRVEDIEIYTDDTGRSAYYIVNLVPSGYVIVSADDRIEPIIGFAAEGIYDLSFGNPLAALVTSDLGGRLEAVRNTFNIQATDSDPVLQHVQLKDNMHTLQGKWGYFVNLAEDSEGRFRSMSLANPGDIRVLPLLQSQWGQAKVCGENLYNYYTPGNYPSGCLATALAQVMRFYDYPTEPIGVHEFAIEISGLRKQSANTRGGDGLGGAYIWSNMPLRPRANCDELTEAQRQAIGALCYDAGVAIGMRYEPDGSGALMPDARDAMVDIFQYNNAILGYDSERNIHSVLPEMINPNLDAKAPVILAISDPLNPGAGHAAVCDGYGYESSTLYHHLNMGWNGIDDLWYNLPDIDAENGKYTTIFGCIYNISTAGAGEIISGRVLDGSGRPISSAKVSAEPGAREPLVVWTDDRGIYAFENLNSNTSYTIWPSADGYVFSSRTVQTLSSDNDSIRVGNCWGIDFHAEGMQNPPPPDIIYVDAYASGDPGPGDSAVSDPDENGSTRHPFDAIQEAINAATSGDTVVIMRGEYSGQGNRDLDFDGKAITVRGEDPNDPSLVIINCEGTAENPHRAFEFHRYETPMSVLAGLTVTGGYQKLGGGIYCGDYARPTLTNCVFLENTGSLGGGLYSESSPILTNCTFIANIADGGGGVYNNGGKSECKPLLSNCVFADNTSKYNGGGIYNMGRYVDTSIIRCEFFRNSVSEGGGGAIRNNTSVSLSVVNGLFVKNSASYGGAIRNSNGGVTTLTNCTFGANSAWSGRALACNPDDSDLQAPGVFQVTNCILWDGGDEIFIGDESIFNVTYSNIQGISGSQPWPGRGNINIDPLFANPDNDDYHLASKTGRWHRNSQSWIRDEKSSPCIDAGDANTPVNIEPAPNGEIVNIGAYGGTPEASKS